MVLIVYFGQVPGILNGLLCLELNLVQSSGRISPAQSGLFGDDTIPREVVVYLKIKQIQAARHKALLVTRMVMEIMR